MFLLTVLGCGLPTNFCDREVRWRESCGESVSDDEVRTCEASVRDCSEDDIAVLDEYAGCLAGAECESEAFFDCAAVLASLQDPRCGFAE